MFRDYTEIEKVDMVAIAILAAMLLIGGVLCSFSFENNRLISPGLNLTGIIIMYVLPAIATVIATLGYKLYYDGCWRHAQTIAEKCGIFTAFGMIVAFHYSSGKGYISGRMVILLLLLWIMAIALALQVDWRYKKGQPNY